MHSFICPLICESALS